MRNAPRRRSQGWTGTLPIIVTIHALLTLALPAMAQTASDSFSHHSPPPPPPPPHPGATDPGPRGGGAGAGGPIAGLSGDQLDYFTAAMVRFSEIDSVTGSIPGEEDGGLGPRFNANSCAACHAFPSIGGSSPPTNPQVAIATLDGATNIVPPFITATGPVREARFIRNPDGSADGGVHDLFVITGRSDAPGCAITQPDFADALARHNVIFRIPTPVFGAGLVENVRDSDLVAADTAHQFTKRRLGIGGHFNLSGNDGTITRFGWKAQNKSLVIFAGEAYNVEQGVTNEVFPNEREDDPNCRFTTQPEDTSFFGPTHRSTSDASDMASDAVNFAMFMRFLAAPQPVALTASAQRGHADFVTTGCEACHFETQTATVSSFTGLGPTSFSPFSDFEVHNMGLGLADGVTQGNANGEQFRTAPLWGLGQRLFFLHDGRAKDLVTAILAHESAGSEANNVIQHYRAMPASDQQDLLNFLRSL